MTDIQDALAALRSYRWALQKAQHAMRINGWNKSEIIWDRDSVEAQASDVVERALGLWDHIDPEKMIDQIHEMILNATPDQLRALLGEKTLARLARQGKEVVSKAMEEHYEQLRKDGEP